MVAPIGDIDIAIGVHRDVGGMIEQARLGIFVRRRAGHPRPQVGHGERVRRHRKRSVFAELHQELACWGQLLDAMILPVRDEDVAILVEGDSPGLIELAVAAAGLAAPGQEFSLAGEHLQPIVSAVHDDDVAVLFAYQAGRTQQLAVAAARLAPLANEPAAAVEHRDGVGPLVGNIHMVVAVDGDAERPGRTPVALAELEELLQQFFLAGTAEPYLVHAHAEVVLVAAVGNVDVAAAAQAHRLRIVEPRAGR